MLNSDLFETSYNSSYCRNITYSPTVSFPISLTSNFSSICLILKQQLTTVKFQVHVRKSTIRQPQRLYRRIGSISVTLYENILLYQIKQHFEQLNGHEKLNIYWSHPRIPKSQDKFMRTTIDFE